MSLTEIQNQASAASDLVQDAINALDNVREKLENAQGLRAEADPDGISFGLNLAEADLAVGIDEVEAMRHRLGQAQRNLAEWSPA